MKKGLYMDIYLTAAEMENVKFLHLTEQEAAEKLFVQRSTVRRHRYNISQKLLTHTTAQAILRALQLGFVTIDDFNLEN